MIDCGEGTQIQLRRSRIRFTKISAVFISHLHGDHCFGLLGMISTFGMLGRTATLHVYAPSDYADLFQKQLDFFCANLEFKVEFHPVDTTKHEVIYEDKSLTVETIPLKHRVPCSGFLFKEKQTLPHIRRDMLDFYQIPISQINNIKLGADWVTPDGDIVPNERLTKPAEKARSYAYCSDTRYIPSLHKIIKNASTLYHESTYDSTLEDSAKKYYHSTAAQAAKVAKDANVGQLVLGHFSARYEEESILLNDASAIFPHCILANEGLVVNV